MRTSSTFVAIAVLGVLAGSVVLGTGCHSKEPASADPTTSAVATGATAQAAATGASGNAVAANPTEHAEVGKPAPDFALQDLDGKDTARRETKAGVVWLAVNSGAPGKQGAGVDANRDGAKTFGMDHPILLDEAGTVGKIYGATNTPHIMVIDPKGTLVYRGAVDNSPDGEGESPTSGKLVSYVENAIADVAAGRPVTTPETKAYGCGVKYGR